MQSRSGVVTWMAAMALIVAAVPAAARAAADYFLQIDGVPGESQDASYKGSIEVSSFSFGASNQSSAAGGAGRTSHSDLTITKSVDQASPLLFKAAATGKHYAVVTLAVRKAGGGGKAYLTYVMHDVMISGVKATANGDKPTESVTFNYAQMETQYEATQPVTPATIERAPAARETAAPQGR